MSKSSEWEAGEWVQVPCSLAGFHTCGSWTKPLNYPCSEVPTGADGSTCYVSHVDYDRKVITISTSRPKPGTITVVE